MAKGGTGFVDAAESYIGTPYVWGGESPSGFDCSGLVQYVADQLGLKNVPRTSEAQWGYVQKIKESQLQPGDLIFEQWPGEASPGHVAIYAGGGQIIQAPAPGQDVQKVAWSPNIVHQEGGSIVGYGRLPGLGGASYSGSSSSSGGSQSAELDSFTSSGSGGVLQSAGSLLHGTAVVLDRAFALFAPGQGWRIVFGAGALVLFFGSFKAFTGGSGA